MVTRYDNRQIAHNNHQLYSNVFQRKRVSFVEQYKTPSLTYPTAEQITKLNLIGHTWTLGDRYYKLAYKHYGDSKLWWILAWFNKKPTDAHINIGDIIYVPLPLEKILQYLDV